MDYKRINEFRLLGLTIAYYRKLRGLTQAELAEATNLSRTHISNIEAPNGKTSISLNKLFDNADVLEVQVKDLFDFRDTLRIASVDTFFVKAQTLTRCSCKKETVLRKLRYLLESITK